MVTGRKRKREIRDNKSFRRAGNPYWKVWKSGRNCRKDKWTLITKTWKNDLQRTGQLKDSWRQEMYWRIYK